MQQVQTYSPTHPNLGLAPYNNHRIADFNNPLYYSLSPLDFEATRINGNILYSLDENIGRALFSALKRLSRYIRVAGNAYEPGLTPGELPLTIPSQLFDKINMPYPSVLYINAYQGANPLFILAPAHKLRTMFVGFQRLSLDAIRWIETANLRAQEVGEASGWQWELAVGHYGGHALTYPTEGSVEHPNRKHLIISNVILLSLKINTVTEERLLVLHPIHSRYAKTHPEFNPFSPAELEENGYVELVPATPPPTAYTASSDSNIASDDEDVFITDDSSIFGDEDVTMENYDLAEE